MTRTARALRQIRLGEAVSVHERGSNIKNLSYTTVNETLSCSYIVELIIRESLYVLLVPLY